MRPWSITPASCSLLILVACGGDTAGPSDQPPLLLEIAGGNGQRAFVGAPTPQPLAVRVVTYTRDPRPGVPVTFALETGDARLEATEARTDTSGVASVPLDLGEKAGPVVVTASGTDLRGSPVTFVLTATPDFSSRPSITTVSSEAVAGFVGHDFLFPAAVLVTDRFDNPIPGMQVDWSVLIGGGSVSWGSSNTNELGIGTAKWTAGPEAGDNRLLATVATGVAVVFTGAGVLPGAGTIAVSASGGSVEGIYLMHPDGSGFTLLPEQGSGSRNPVWSPDGSRLAYNTTRFGGVEVAVMQPDGTGLVRATPMPEGATAQVLGWSADGTRILFASDVDTDVGQLYVANADGSGTREAIPNTEGVISADWSPDGSRIAIGTGSPEAIAVIDADGGGLTHLATGADPHWSRDGSTIAFNLSRAEGGSQPMLMHPDGTGQVSFPGTTGVPDLKFQSWSPDGAKALFTAVPPGQASDDEFYSINADGSGLVQITNDAVVTLGGSWGP